MQFNAAAVLPILMLIGSNLFMTIAWYGHLKFPNLPMWVAVMGSWMVALCEYWLAVPANRIGYGTYSAAELKTIQEVITLTVFVGFAVVVLALLPLSSPHAAATRPSARRPATSFASRCFFIVDSPPWVAAGAASRA